MLNIYLNLFICCRIALRTYNIDHKVSLNIDRGSSLHEGPCTRDICALEAEPFLVYQIDFSHITSPDPCCSSTDPVDPSHESEWQWPDSNRRRQQPHHPELGVAASTTELRRAMYSLVVYSPRGGY